MPEPKLSYASVVKMPIKNEKRTGELSMIPHKEIRSVGAIRALRPKRSREVSMRPSKQPAKANVNTEDTKRSRYTTPQLGKNLPYWTCLQKADFITQYGNICNVPIAMLAYSNDDVTRTEHGNFSIKNRYVIPVALKPLHMDVLILSTSGGTGGAKLPSIRKKFCVSFFGDEDREAQSKFPNSPIRLPRSTRYQPPVNGAWTDLTYTVPIAYDSRVKLKCELPKEQKDHLLRLYRFFQADQMDHRGVSPIDREWLKSEKAWFQTQLTKTSGGNAGH